MSTDVVVVGAGLFGATIARALRSVGVAVTVVDARLPDSGSPPSGSLMKPTWFSGLGPTVYKPALDLLHRLYAVHTIHFRIAPKFLHLNSEVFHVRTEDIIDLPGVVRKNVATVEPKKVTLAGGEVIETRAVVVAAGHWTGNLLPQVTVEGRKGISVRYHGTTDPTIRPWAPYKQMVKFNEDPENVWAGDGTAIIPKNWNDDRMQQSMERLDEFCGSDRLTVMRWRTGIRPYCPGKKYLVELVRPGVWVATGGAKNGLIAAGYAAHTILEAFK